MSITEDHELGLMSGMVTSTQNDASPELLAHARRGPCAKPTDEEMCEYLMARRAPGSQRAKVQEDATAAVVSFQHRTHVLKHHFLRRHRRTPLGISTNHWDRTEAQKRHALHAHIPWWAKRRWPTPGYKARPPIPEKAARVAPTLSPKEANAEDDVYYKAEMARIIAELVRPLPLSNTTSEMERDHNLWAFLLRAIQTHLYIHACTPLYCLKNRASCRFFFP